MATKAKDDAPEGKSGKSGKSGKGKLIVIILIVLVLLLGGGGAAAWWFLLRKPDAKPGAKPAAEAAKPVHFINLQPFVTNVQSNDGQPHYLQVTVDLKATDPAVEEQVKELMPEIRSTILNILAAQQASDATLEATRDKLRTTIQAQVNQILLRNAGAKPHATPPISGVYFSGYVLQ